MRTDTIIRGESLDILRTLAGESVNCIVTAIPYWGMPNYDIPGQVGQEPTLDEFVVYMVGVFREARRVLRRDGTLWLKAHDTYSSERIDHGWLGSRLKPKDLVMYSAIVAGALQDDGWYLRQRIACVKRNPMSETVKDRPSTSFDLMFLLAKSERYWYDADAIREPVTGNAHSRGKGVTPASADPDSGIKANTSYHEATRNLVNTRNSRDVWEYTGEKDGGAMPSSVAERCIRAGCPTGGIVLDPFMDKGTVAIVAKQNNRHYLGIESNPDRVTIAKLRIKAG